MTKAEIIEQLEELGINHDPKATKAELEELLNVNSLASTKKSSHKAKIFETAKFPLSNMVIGKEVSEAQATKHYDSLAKAGWSVDTRMIK